MDMDLSPKLANQKVFDGEGGSYYSWSSAEFPILSQAKVAAGRLSLQPRGFALPHYADSNKLGYVLQGTGGLAGMVLPGKSEEEVLKLSKGDMIIVPIGGVSWWFNNGDSDLVIVFLGETSTAYVKGEFSYFFVSGALSMLSGFSSEFNSRALNVSEDQVEKLVKSQNGALLIKLEDGLSMPEPSNKIDIKMVLNINEAKPSVAVKNAGSVATIGGSEMGFLGKVGLSGRLVKLDANAMCSPVYGADSVVQVIYAVRGSGRVQIVGLNGKQVLDSEVKVGQMFVVPRLFVVAIIAGQDGLEYFSVLTASEANLEAVITKKSIWEAFSPQVVKACLNVSPELEEIFKCNLKSTALLIPPKN